MNSYVNFSMLLICSHGFSPLSNYSLRLTVLTIQQTTFLFYSLCWYYKFVSPVKMHMKFVLLWFNPLLFYCLILSISYRLFGFQLYLFFAKVHFLPFSCTLLLLLSLFLLLIRLPDTQPAGGYNLYLGDFIFFFFNIITDKESLARSTHMFI